MKFLFITSIILFIGCQETGNRPSTLPNIIKSAVVGGEIVKNRDEFKSIVALTDSIGEVYCSGTLIKKDLVLTAAHCVQGNLLSLPIESRFVFVGNRSSKNINKRDGDYYKIKSYFQHPLYNKIGDELYDLAIIKLSSNVDIDESELPLLPTDPSLPLNRNDIFEFAPDHPLTIVGFGRDDDDKAGTKRSVESTYRNTHPLKFAIYDVIVTGGLYHNANHGDSGSGLIYKRDKKRSIVAGVASSGITYKDYNSKNESDGFAQYSATYVVAEIIKLIEYIEKGDKFFALKDYEEAINNYNIVLNSIYPELLANNTKVIKSLLHLDNKAKAKKLINTLDSISVFKTYDDYIDLFKFKILFKQKITSANLINFSSSSFKFKRGRKENFYKENWKEILKNCEPDAIVKFLQKSESDNKFQITRLVADISYQLYPTIQELKNVYIMSSARKGIKSVIPLLNRTDYTGDWDQLITEILRGGNQEIIKNIHITKDVLTNQQITSAIKHINIDQLLFYHKNNMINQSIYGEKKEFPNIRTFNFPFIKEDKKISAITIFENSLKIGSLEVIKFLLTNNYLIFKSNIVRRKLIRRLEQYLKYDSPDFFKFYISFFNISNFKKTMIINKLGVTITNTIITLYAEDEISKYLFESIAGDRLAFAITYGNKKAIKKLIEVGVNLDTPLNKSLITDHKIVAQKLGLMELFNSEY